MRGLGSSGLLGAQALKETQVSDQSHMITWKETAFKEKHFLPEISFKVVELSIERTMNTTAHLSYVRDGYLVVISSLYSPPPSQCTREAVFLLMSQHLLSKCRGGKKEFGLWASLLESRNW